MQAEGTLLFSQERATDPHPSNPNGIINLCPKNKTKTKKLYCVSDITYNAPLAGLSLANRQNVQFLLVFIHGNNCIEA